LDWPSPDSRLRQKNLESLHDRICEELEKLVGLNEKLSSVLDEELAYQSQIPKGKGGDRGLRMRYLPHEFLALSSQILDFLRNAQIRASQSEYGHFILSLTDRLHEIEERVKQAFAESKLFYQDRQYCPILKIRLDSYHEYLTDPGYRRKYDEPKPKREFDIRETIPKELHRYIPFHAQTVQESLGFESDDEGRGFEYLMDRPLEFKILFSHRHKYRTGAYVSAIEIEIEDAQTGEFINYPVYNSERHLLPAHENLRFSLGEAKLLYDAINRNLQGKPFAFNRMDMVSHLNTFIFRVLGIPHLISACKDRSTNRLLCSIREDYRDRIVLKPS
jgi:hypothetical protein